MGRGIISDNTNTSISDKINNDNDQGELEVEEEGEEIWEGGEVEATREATMRVRQKKIPKNIIPEKKL